MNNTAIGHLPVTEAPRYRLRPTDRIDIDGLDYAPVSSDQFGYVFRRVGDDGGLAISMTYVEIEERMKRGRFAVHRDWYDPRKANVRLRNPAPLLCDLPEKEQRVVLWRIEYCERFLRAEASEPNVSRADEAMRPAIVRIQDDLLRLEAARQGKPRRCGRKTEHFDPPSPRALRRWLTAYVASGLSPMSLRPGHHRSGNRRPRFDGDSQAFALRHAWSFASLNRPSKALVYSNYEDALSEENRAREQRGEPPLNKVGRRSFEGMICRFSPFAIFAGRYGKAAALQRFAIVNRGLDVTRPLERVEMDEYCVSLQTVLIEAGLWANLSVKLKAEIERTRTWLSVVIDCATHCILAMRLLAAPPSSESALAALEMAIYDKAHLSDAVGAGCRWEMSGMMETLATDGGAAFISLATQSALRDLGIAHEVPPGGTPFLRGTIERFFLTVQSRLLPLFPGQTFQNAICKGDYDAEGNACLNVEELNRVLLRYAVDIYHNSPHEGLGGETPRNAWRRLTNLWGVFPAPEHIRRHVFGVATTRQINNRGIRFFGLHYQSLELQKLRFSVGQKAVAIRVNQHDLGSISVQQGNGWISVPCVFSEVSGTSVWEWISAALDLRRRNADTAALDKTLVQEAMAGMRLTATMATKRAELGEPILTLADLDKLEHELFRSFAFASPPAPCDENLLGAGESVGSGIVSDEIQQYETQDNEFGGPDDWLRE